MIAEIAEFEAARRLVDMEIARAAARRAERAALGPGSASCWKCRRCCGSCRRCCERVDFLSIGTNDLAQFLFACDRGNPRLAERYDLLSAPMLALFRQVIAAVPATPARRSASAARWPATRSRRWC